MIDFTKDKEFNLRHNCGKEKDLDLSWIDPTGNTPDRIKCNICGREFIDMIFIRILKENLNCKCTTGYKCLTCEIIDSLAGEKLK